MNVAVQLFARARDLVGGSPVELELADGATVADLRTALRERCPTLGDLVPHLHVAVGQDYAADDTAIPAGAEVACFPPVSGG